ncbi:DNA polymerase III subunit epsilon [Bowdeniella nasicola]|uniref:DNA polymerase III subunit epsilon n=1 Tax=Bowdeniella nasicola TaxID=208480 RepID=A0A1Q5Q3N4_9ACTO|nr:exonuclease domain-containing protein [Bowdeniella nasicola]OKL54395.1 DNA polymerase III subunit epsilon [Bowdeniella nasicola]
MSVTDGPLLGFDTETTGINAATDRIVTAALVYDDGRGNRDTITYLIDPGVEIPQAASNVHGITTEIARLHGKPPAPVLAEISARLADSLRAGIPIVAFNAAYDLSILDAELARHELPRLTDTVPLTPVLDPLVIDRAVDRYRRGKRRLGDICAAYGLAVSGDLHTAEVDVLATLDVLRAIFATHTNLREMNPDELHTWQQVAHKDWAESFNLWRVSKGLAGPGASPHWPVEPR